ncbi:MAG: hypothetical protein IPH09_16785 [bacterium]|nr:hypothetical protein [bacterium]
MNRRFQSLIALIAVTLASWATPPRDVLGNQAPVLSGESQLIEISSPSEWLIRAAGYGPRKRGEIVAIDDARWSAVRYVAIGGTDPLVQTPAERERFSRFESKLREPAELAKYITWESSKLVSRTEIGDRVKIVKDFKVNRKMLQDDLITAGIVDDVDEAALGYPTIMVLPLVDAAEDPIRALSDPVIGHIAGSIESHLTAQGYDVLVPSQNLLGQEVVEASRTIRSIYSDDQRALALAYGSDIYMSFSVLWNDENIGGAWARKASVVVRMFEATTSRLLGTETGYSGMRPATDEVLAEEAINDAVPKVVSRAQRYWKEDRARGQQYLAHVSFSGGLSRDAIQRIQDGLPAYFREAGHIVYFKEEVVTESSADYRLWCDPDRIGSARELGRKLGATIEHLAPGTQVRMPILTRKMAILEVSR